MSPEFVFKDTDHESRLIRRRILIVGGIILLLIVLVVSRVAYLQIVRHEHFTTLSQDNRVKILPLPPTRGLIYSSDGVLLAENQPSYSLEIIPEQIDDLELLIDQLSGIIDIDKIDIDRFFASLKRVRRFEQVPLRLNLTDVEVARFAVQRHRFPGVDVTARLKRYYPLGPDTAHIIGYVGRIDERDQATIDLANYRGTNHIGKSGIERAYEHLLHGRVGYEQVEVNAQGRILRVLDRTPPKPGQNLRLTLDVSLQEAAMDALEGWRGAIVAIDPRNGDILAMVSTPAYDSNLFVDGIRSDTYRDLRDSPDRPLFNRALQGQYPPGSTIKPFLALGALELDIRRAADRTWCPGWYSLPGSSHRYRDWRREGHGHVDLADAVIQSCDVYFYALATDMGINKMHDFLSLFGFGVRTGIEITNESPGNLPSPEWKRRARGQPWFPGETVITAIGQGAFLSTPMQLAAATAVLANHGKFRTPHFLHEAFDPLNGEVTTQYSPNNRTIKVRNNEYWMKIEQAMVDTVHGPRGTARRIGMDASYTIAGKTGTAQVIGIAQGEEYDKDVLPEKFHDHALFIAYAPVEEPRVAVAILVENGGSGSRTAAPMARKIFDHILLPDDS
jgi:penicillin-binding protein 2